MSDKLWNSSGKNINVEKQRKLFPAYRNQPFRNKAANSKGELNNENRITLRGA